MMRVFLDIETLPPREDERDQFPESLVRKLARRRRADDAEECSEVQYRRLALHGECGRLLTISVIVEYEGEVVHRGLLGRERPTSQFHFDEARTLRAFWKLVRGFNPGRDLFVGHNLMQFDLPFLYKRSMINRVQPTVEVSLARYRKQPVYDTMRVWSGWDSRHYLSLTELGGLLGLGGKAEGMDGGCVYDCIVRGEHDRVARYALQDVELVRAIYYRMAYPEFFIPYWPPEEAP